MFQETMVYVGQMETYGKGCEVLEKLAGVRVSEAQLYRVTDRYGALLEEEIGYGIEVPLPQEATSVGEEEVVYAQMDGGMPLIPPAAKAAGTIPAPPNHSCR